MNTKKNISKIVVSILMFSFVLLVPLATGLADSTGGAQPTANQRNPYFCQGLSKSSGVGDVLNLGSCILVRSVFPLLFALASVAFVWGIIQYFLNPDNEEKKKKGKSYAIWGLIGLFVMVAMWGLVAVLSNTFFGSGAFVIPQLSQ